MNQVDLTVIKYTDILHTRKVLKDIITKINVERYYCTATLYKDKRWLYIIGGS